MNNVKNIIDGHNTKNILAEPRQMKPPEHATVDNLKNAHYPETAASSVIYQATVTTNDSEET